MRKMKTEAEQKIYLLREECTVGKGKERQTIRKEKRHLTQSFESVGWPAQRASDRRHLCF